jgi:hypothetical protein
MAKKKVNQKKSKNKQEPQITSKKKGKKKK